MGKESEGEKIVRHWLEANAIKFKQEVVSSSGHTFDFAVMRGRTLCLIEYHGWQHYHPNNDSQNCFKDFLRTVRRDHIKEKWCKDQNRELLVIPYWEASWVSSVLNDFFMFRIPQFSPAPKLVEKYQLHREQEIARWKKTLKLYHGEYDEMSEEHLRKCINKMQIALVKKVKLRVEKEKQTV